MDDFRKIQVGVVTSVIIALIIIWVTDVDKFKEAAETAWGWLQAHTVILLVFFLLAIYHRFPNWFMRLFTVAYVGLMLSLVWTVDSWSGLLSNPVNWMNPDLVQTCLLPLAVLYYLLSTSSVAAPQKDTEKKKMMLKGVVYLVFFMYLWAAGASGLTLTIFTFFPLFGIFFDTVVARINKKWPRMPFWLSMLLVVFIAMIASKANDATTHSMLMAVLLFALMDIDFSKSTMYYWLAGFMVAYVITMLSMLGPILGQSNVAMFVALTYFALLVLLTNLYVFNQPLADFLSNSAFYTVFFTALAVGITYAIQLVVQAFMVGYVLDVSSMIFFLAVVGFIVWLVSVLGIRPEYFSKVNYILKWLVVMACWAADNAPVRRPLKTYLILLLEIGLIVLYFYRKRIEEARLKGGNGTVVVRDPISLSKASSYNMKNYGFNYAISFWVFLNPQRPEETPLTTTFVNLLSFEGKPAVMYNAASNTARVTMVNTEGDNILMADMPNVLLQKWNHFMVISNQGRFDLFVNGELLKTITVVQDIQDAKLVIGEDGGANGKICNVMVFFGTQTTREAPFDPVTYGKITSIYEKFKGKNPPTI